MPETVTLHSTRCAICNTEDHATEIYPASFDVQAFNPNVFSARRLPDRIHYRMVKCSHCGLVRSDPVAPPEVMAQLYKNSSFDYADEVENLKFTYGRYLSKLSDYGVRKGALLEVGCGNGFFLEEALRQGYTTVRGVEPSRAAVAGANSEVRPHIVYDVMRSGLFEPDQFDVICMFQVFDHIPDPRALLEECLRVLKPGGLMLVLNHNIEAVSARLLKERSPIIDIEHTYLYSPATIARIFTAHGFQIRRVGSVTNNYTFYYLARLTPFPASLKQSLLALLKGNPIGRLRVKVPLGNLYLIAQKPVDEH
jgi:SAM-dependent methyltransferase